MTVGDGPRRMPPILRREQMAAFREDRLRRLTRRSLDRLRRRFPDDCDALGDEELSRRVDDLLTRLRLEGIHGEDETVDEVVRRFTGWHDDGDELAFVVVGP